MLCKQACSYNSLPGVCTSLTQACSGALSCSESLLFSTCNKKGVEMLMMLGTVKKDSSPSLPAAWIS